MGGSTVQPATVNQIIALRTTVTEGVIYMTRCGLQEWVWLIGGGVVNRRGVVNMRGVANMRRGCSLYTVDVIEEGVTYRGANLNTYHRVGRLYK